MVFRHFWILELGISECGWLLSKAGGSLHREGACPQASLPSFPLLLGTGEERGLVGAEASKEFPNRKTNGCGAPGRGRAFPGCLGRESPGRSRQLAGMWPGQSPGRGWAAGRRGHGWLPVTKQDPPCGPLPDPQRLAATLQGAGRTRPLGPRSVPPHSFRQASASREAQRLHRGLRGDVGRNSTTYISIHFYFIVLHFNLLFFLQRSCTSHML